MKSERRTAGSIAANVEYPKEFARFFANILSPVIWASPLKHFPTFGPWQTVRSGDALRCGSQQEIGRRFGAIVNLELPMPNTCDVGVPHLRAGLACFSA